jgi:hypothetical protein
MARLFMDMWQEQMKQFMQDERYLNASLDMFQKMQQGYSPASERDHAESSDCPPTDTARTATSASASVDEHGKLSLIAERLAICERRILELERLVADLEKRA